MGSKRTTEKIRFPISTVAVQAGNGFSFPLFGSVIFSLSEKVRFFYKKLFQAVSPGESFFNFLYNIIKKYLISIIKGGKIHTGIICTGGAF